MDWIVTVGDSCLETLGWMAAFTVVFGLLVHAMPCNRGMFWWKDGRAVGTDLLYWFAVPLLLRGCRTWMLAAAIALLLGGMSGGTAPAGAAPASAAPASATPGFELLHELPLWQQCLAILVIQDVMLYWIHRAFHTRLAWSFHAVHHSPTVLDWMSAARFHLVNQLLSFILADVVVLLLGFSPAALLALTPFNMIYSSMVHANLNWTFGPLRHVFASPVFHRWHHTAEGEGINRNFAPTFPLLDVIFGTFYMPPGRLPQQFGIHEPDFPEDFWGQLLHPFRTSPAPAALPEPASAGSCPDLPGREAA